MSQTGGGGAESHSSHRFQQVGTADPCRWRSRRRRDVLFCFPILAGTPVRRPVGHGCPVILFAHLCPLPFYHTSFSPLGRQWSVASPVANAAPARRSLPVHRHWASSVKFFDLLGSSFARLRDGEACVHPYGVEPAQTLRRPRPRAFVPVVPSRSRKKVCTTREGIWANASKRLRREQSRVRLGGCLPQAGTPPSRGGRSPISRQSRMRRRCLHVGSVPPLQPPQACCHPFPNQQRPVFPVVGW
jgi:hypothetical protein